MFEKISKSADSVLKDLLSLALDPKTITYIINKPKEKKVHGKYEIIKLSAELGNKRKPSINTPAAVIKSPTSQPFKPTAVVTQGIQKIHSDPKVAIGNKLKTKPIYSNVSQGRMFQIARSTEKYITR